MATYHSIHFWKRDLRSQMKRQLRELQVEEYEAKSAEICSKVKNKFATAHVVAVFAHSPFEPNLETLWTEGFFAHRIALYPKIAGDNLVLCPVASREDLRPGPFGIGEPISSPIQLRPDVMLVPGLAFSSEGFRLGRGAGFYDRFLGATSVDLIKVGICFDFQMVPELPVEPHDVPMDLLITG